MEMELKVVDNHLLAPKTLCMTLYNKVILDQPELEHVLHVIT